MIQIYLVTIENKVSIIFTDDIISVNNQRNEVL